VGQSSLASAATQNGRYQGGLGIVEPRGELVSCSLRISDQRRDSPRSMPGSAWPAAT